jgi:hypothetical protein
VAVAHSCLQGGGNAQSERSSKWGRYAHHGCLRKRGKSGEGRGYRPRERILIHRQHPARNNTDTHKHTQEGTSAHCYSIAPAAQPLPPLQPTELHASIARTQASLGTTGPLGVCRSGNCSTASRDCKDRHGGADRWCVGGTPSETVTRGTSALPTPHQHPGPHVRQTRQRPQSVWNGAEEVVVCQAQLPAGHRQGPRQKGCRAGHKARERWGGGNGTGQTTTPSHNSPGLAHPPPPHSSAAPPPHAQRSPSLPRFLLQLGKR